MRSSANILKNGNTGDAEDYTTFVPWFALAAFPLSSRFFTGIAVILGLGYLIYRRAIHERGQQLKPIDVVEIASDDSFPASDPPGWSGTG